ncbi:MAG: NAD(P)H-dependent oxidoreductase [Bacteroidota bacterium]
MISIVIGTNRADSVTKKVAIFYKNLLENIGNECQIIDLNKLPSDFTFSALYENSNKNLVFNEFKQKIESSEKFVFIVPEYNGSFPGVLKAFIDGLSFPGSLIHKKAALVGISDGVQGGAMALSHLTDIFHYLGLNVLAQKVKIPNLKKNFVDGKITDPLISSLINEQALLISNF